MYMNNHHRCVHPINKSEREKDIATIMFDKKLVKCGFNKLVIVKPSGSQCRKHSHNFKMVYCCDMLQVCVKFLLCIV